MSAASPTFFTALFAGVSRQAPRQLRRALPPALGITLFLVLWTGMAQSIDTSLGAFPAPKDVWVEAGNLWDEHLDKRAKAEAFYEREEALERLNVIRDNYMQYREDLQAAR